VKCVCFGVVENTVLKSKKILASLRDLAMDDASYTVRMGYEAKYRRSCKERRRKAKAAR
jgi:hypothetical protein